MVTSGSSDTAKGIMELVGDVPVIFFNRAVDEDGVEASASVLNAYENIAFVGTDAPGAGHLQGKMVGEYVLEHYDEARPERRRQDLLRHVQGRRGKRRGHLTAPSTALRTPMLS